MVLPLLAAQISERDLRHHPDRARPPARRHLPRRGRRQHRRRLYLLDPDPPRLLRERRPQVGDARVPRCVWSPSCSPREPRISGRCRLDQPGDGRTSRVVSQPLYSGFGHIPSSRRRIRRWHRRLRRCARRNDDRNRDRLSAAMVRQLRADLHPGGLVLPLALSVIHTLVPHLQPARL